MNYTRYVGLSIVSVLVLLSFVAAAGVSSPYWDSPGNENPLIISPGETRDIEFGLQNNVGDSEVVFVATLINDGTVARLTDTSLEYRIAVGETKPVRMRIHVPSDVPIGTTYKVTVGFQSKQASPSGTQFAIGSAIEKSFDVIVQERVATSPGAGLNTYLYLIVGLVIVAIIFFMVWLKRKNASAA